MTGTKLGKATPLRIHLTVACALLILGLTAGCASKAPSPPPGATYATKSRAASPKADAVIRTARLMIGAPYKWGGESPKQGFDCSGLVWFAYRQNGISLPRVSWQQFGVGTPIKKGEIRPGDLIFHKVEKKGKSLHVGIVTDRGTFVHAPSSGKRVMESSLSNSYWQKHYIGARRVL